MTTDDAKVGIIPLSSGPYFIKYEEGLEKYYVLEDRRALFLLWENPGNLSVAHTI
jgi:hypothetical protein